jgi:hypothetical protein
MEHLQPMVLLQPLEVPTTVLADVAMDFVTPHSSNSCNHTLLIDVIKCLNHFGTGSIKFYPHSKGRTEFQFSFEIYCPLVQMSNTKVVPNILIHLQKHYHIFLKLLGIFPAFFQLLC